jgi:flagellar hook-associated protein 3 FlgL
MRVAFNALSDSLMSQLNVLGLREIQLQNQAASGKRFTLPADDPAAMRRVLDWQAQDSQLAQYRQNVASLQGRATASYTAIHGLQTIVQRATEIATLADGTRSPQELSAYATEVNQLIQQGVGVMNGQYQGDYLFGGTRSSLAPFTATTDSQGHVTAVSYQGNASVPTAEIGSGTTISVQVPGANTSGSGPDGLITDSRNGADLFNHLIALAGHLRAGDTTAIAVSDNPALAKDEANITSQVTANGLVQSQLAAADSLAASQSAAIRQMISQASDVDLAQTLTQLSATQTAYQAALQSGASLLNHGQSLLDYLH